jgi:uncharacterized membrane protein YgdD (TMEM256/DUF423 family)
MEIKSICTLRWGVVLIGLSIILGAMGAHALEKVWSPEHLKSYLTGVHYLLIHGLAFLFLSLLSFDGMRWVLRLLKSGIVAFSGSIFVLILLSENGIKPALPLVLLTPTGGTLLIAGWFLLLYFSFTARFSKHSKDK